MIFLTFPEATERKDAFKQYTFPLDAVEQKVNFPPGEPAKSRNLKDEWIDCLTLQKRSYQQIEMHINYFQNTKIRPAMVLNDIPLMHRPRSI